jgi:predicted  nucleic acid-binding Zn-ribbon protein
MSDSGEDWENACDDVIEDKKEEEKKEEGKFVDEDAVDSDEEREKAKVVAAEKKKVEEAKPKVPKKGKKDYEALYAERMGKGAAKAAALAG